MSNTVKRFILLGGEKHYAHGGFHDFISSHALLEDAVNRGNKGLDNWELVIELADQDQAKRNNNALVAEGDEFYIQWFHVWDCVTREIVECSPSQAYDAPNGRPEMEENSHA